MLLVEKGLKFGLDYLKNGEEAIDRYRNPYWDYRNDPLKWTRDILFEDVTEEVANMMRSVVNNTVTFAQSGNATGKSHGAARIAAHFFCCYKDAQVYTAAAPPESNLKRILWGELGHIVENFPELFKDCSKVSLDSMLIKRSGRSRIEGLTIHLSGTEKEREAKFSGKHSPHLLFIIDEGDAVPEEVYAGIESCMSGGMVRLLILFNPREEVGPVYQRQKDGKGVTVHLQAFNHPNVYSGQDIFPGAVSREITVRRIHDWTLPLDPDEKPNDECFEVPQFLVGCRAVRHDGGWYPPLPAGFRRVENQMFWYMVLGRYPAVGENQLISRVWIDEAITRGQLYRAQYGDSGNYNGILPTMSLDVSELGEDRTVATLKYGSRVAPQIVWQKVDPIETGDKAWKIYINAHAQYCNVDGTGVGASVAPYMNRKGSCIAHRIMVSSKATPMEGDNPNELPSDITGLGEFDSVRDQMLWGLREWLRTDKGAMLPDDPQLREELLAPKYRPLRGKIKVDDTDTIKQKIKRSPDKLMSLALQFAPQNMDAPGLLYVSSYIRR